MLPYWPIWAHNGRAGNTKGGSITVPLTSCLTALITLVLQIKTKIVSCHTADFKPVKQEVNGTAILPPLVRVLHYTRLERFANENTLGNWAHL